MNTRKMTARRVKEEGVNEEVPPQGGQVPQGVQVPSRVDKVTIVDEGNEVSVVYPNMNNREIREALLSLARDMTTHV